MPEGHTIRRLARDLKATFGAQDLQVSSPQGRFGTDAALVDGRRMLGTDAYGKHLFLGFEGRLYVHVHLGLYGKVTVRQRPEPAPVGAVRMRLVGEHAYADLRGPTACEVVDAKGKKAIAQRLGADPLRADADPVALAARVARSPAPIGALLLQQEIIAGVGNVYRAEVLFRHGVWPFRPSRDVEPATWDAIWGDLGTLMRQGVRLNRIVTTEPADRPRRSRVPTRAESFYVYERAGEPCRRCGTPIADGELAQRRIVWCPTCQSR